MVCGTYAGSSSALTTTNKKIYAKFGEVSPINLLMVQCFINVIICSLMMLYKESNRSAYHSLVKYDIVIPPLSDMPDKARLGFKVGAFNLATVLFGLYSVKFVSIPL